MSKNQDAVEDFFTTEMIYREIHEIEGLNLNIPIIFQFQRNAQDWNIEQ